MALPVLQLVSLTPQHFLSQCKRHTVTCIPVKSKVSAFCRSPHLRISVDPYKDTDSFHHPKAPLHFQVCTPPPSDPTWGSSPTEEFWRFLDVMYGFPTVHIFVSAFITLCLRCHLGSELNITGTGDCCVKGHGGHLVSGPLGFDPLSSGSQANLLGGLRGSKVRAGLAVAWLVASQCQFLLVRWSVQEVSCK